MRINRRQACRQFYCDLHSKVHAKGLRMASFKSDCVYVTNKSKLSFKHMWNRDDLSDVRLTCDQEVFRLHRCLLAACSPYFRTFFQKTTSTNLNIVLEDVKSDDLRRILHYMYNGFVTINDTDVQAFCEILEMLLMPIPDDIDVSCSEDIDDDDESESNGNENESGTDGESDTARETESQPDSELKSEIELEIPG